MLRTEKTEQNNNQYSLKKKKLNENLTLKINVKTMLYGVEHFYAQIVLNLYLYYLKYAKNDTHLL